MKTIYIIYCALITLAVFSAPASADCNIVGDAKTKNSSISIRMVKEYPQHGLIVR